MKLFDYCRNEDYGVEHVFTLCKGKRRSVLQVSFDWNEYPSGFYLQIGIGNNRLIDILFGWWKLGFAFELFGVTWRSWEVDNEKERSISL